MAMFNNNYGYGAYNNPMLQQQMQAPQIQNSGLISVRNEMEARNYPIAPGNSITFKDESAPYVYVKTMGLSQFDQPVFEKFRLVKEEAQPPQIGNVAQAEFVLKSEFDALKAQIETFMNSTKEGPAE